MKLDKKYEEMLKKIIEHPEFNNRNPVDIGIECGYSEEYVIEMINSMYRLGENEKTEKAYLVLDNVSTHYLISIDTSTFEAKVLRKLDDKYKMKLRGNILAYVYGDQYSANYGMRWENIETGKENEILVSDYRIDIGSIKNYDENDFCSPLDHDAYVDDYQIVKDGIIVLCGVYNNGYLRIILKVGFDGQVIRKYDWNCGPIDDPLMIAEDEKGVYFLAEDYVYLLNNKFDEMKKIYDKDSEFILAGYDYDDFFCYARDCNGKNYILGKNEGNKKIPSYLLEDTEDEEWTEGISGIEELVITKNFKLTKDSILEGNKKVSSQLWPLGQQETSMLYAWRHTNYGEGSFKKFISLPDDDIVIGVEKVNHKPCLVKIDLMNNTKGYIDILGVDKLI